MTIPEFYDELKRLIPTYPYLNPNCSLGECLIIERPDVLHICWKCSGIIKENKCSFCGNSTQTHDRKLAENINTNITYIEYIKTRINSCIYGLDVCKRSKETFSCNYNIMMLSFISEYLTREELDKYGHETSKTKIKSCIEKYPEFKDRVIQILENRHNSKIQDIEHEIKLKRDLIDSISKDIYILHKDPSDIIERNMILQLEYYARKRDDSRTN